VPELEVVTGPLTALGESPLWDVDEQRLYWIDVFGQAILRATADGREMRVWRFPGRPTSLARSRDARMIVTSRARILRFDLEADAVEVIAEPAGDSPMVFNDSAVDRLGRRYFTGLSDHNVMGPDKFDLVGAVEQRAPIYSLDTDGHVRDVGQRVGLSNGPAFSPDGATLYWNDSWTREILAFDYDDNTGSVLNRRVHVAFHADTPPGSIAVPDGATVDDTGCLWVACCYGGEIRRYTPDGELDRRIDVPLESPTSVAFGGPDLDVLFVTSMALTAFPGASPIQSGLAGCMLAVHSLGVRGIPESRFEG
jgi:sugar lactone lactonase YvrE